MSISLVCVNLKTIFTHKSLDIDILSYLWEPVSRELAVFARSPDFKTEMDSYDFIFPSESKEAFVESFENLVEKISSIIVLPKKDQLVSTASLYSVLVYAHLLQSEEWEFNGNGEPICRPHPSDYALFDDEEKTLLKSAVDNAVQGNEEFVDTAFESKQKTCAFDLKICNV